MRFLELRVPPPIVAALFATLMWLTARYAPWAAVFIPGRRWIAILLAAAGVAVSLTGVASFRRAKTTVNPLTPEKASSLVISGIYRITRNPMYLGLSIVLLAWAVY